MPGESMMNLEEFDEIVATCDLYRQMTCDPAAAINLFSALMQLSDWNSEIQDEIQKSALPYRKMTTTHLTNAGRS
jgi:hypothetical protein